MSDQSLPPHGLINQAPSSDQKPSDAEEEAMADLEFERAFMALPTTFIDTFHMTYWRGHVKIVLGEESVAGEDHWRIAILMQVHRVKKLISRLQNTLKTLEEREKESS